MALIDGLDVMLHSGSDLGPLIAMISGAEHPASARRRQAALRRPWKE
jgi:hypothetical protein